MAVKEPTGNPDRAAPSRNAVPLLLRLGLTILLLALILRTVSLREIVAALRGASPWPLACGAAFGVVFSALKVFRWGWLLRRLGAPCTAAESLYSYLGGMAVGLLTPGRVGEMARAMYLRTGDRAFVAGAAFLDKVFDVTVVLIVGAAGCAMQGLAIPAAALALAALALYLLIFLPARVLDRLTGLVPIAAARRVASSLSQPLARAGGGTVLLGALQAALTFAAVMLQFHLLLSAFGPAPAGATLFVLPLVVLSNLIPLTISGVGVREWASVILFRQYGVGGPVAVNVALLLYVFNSLLPGLAGSLLSPRLRRRGVEGDGGASR